MVAEIGGGASLNKLSSILTGAGVVCRPYPSLRLRPRVGEGRGSYSPGQPVFTLSEERGDRAQVHADPR
jgi:hypothetical protein